MLESTAVESMSTHPKLIILISGKRKSGKDELAKNIKKHLKNNCEVIRISEPIKEHFAKERGLDLSKLLSSDQYKEEFRLEMIAWSEKERQLDPGVFCRAACRKASSNVPVWIVSDIRRHTDIHWFYSNYKKCDLKTVKVTADLDTRIERGFVFTKGVDDAPSECDLDDYVEWDYVFINNNKEEMQRNEKLLLELVNVYCK